ncbi:hypothetical protein Bca4012_020586 [Brassica carinata]
MAKTGGGYSFSRAITRHLVCSLFQFKVSGLIKGSVKSKIVKETFIISEGEGAKASCYRDYIFLHRKELQHHWL